MHVRNICVLEIHACQKYMHVNNICIMLRQIRTLSVLTLKKKQLPVKNTLRYLGKSHVKIAKISFYFYLFATNSYKLFGLSKKKKKQKQKKILKNSIALPRFHSRGNKTHTKVIFLTSLKYYPVIMCGKCITGCGLTYLELMFPFGLILQPV